MDLTMLMRRGAGGLGGHLLDNMFDKKYQNSSSDKENSWKCKYDEKNGHKKLPQV